MSFWKSLKKAAQVIAPAVITVAMPEAAINFGLVGVAKHTNLINNQHLPVLNMAVSTTASYLMRALDTGDWVSPILPALQEGGLLTGMSTALHQTIKIPMSQITGPIAARVGPGDKFSI